MYELLTEMLQHPPQHVHLVLISRRDPFLPISVLRAQGQVNEIGVRDLRFTTAETEVYLHQVLNKPIEEKTAAAWTEKTEGWVTGLCLAAISMRHLSDPAGMLSKVPEGIPYVMEYFYSEVIAHQPPDIRVLLERTAILDRFCAPLCEAVCRDAGRSGQDESDFWAFILYLKTEKLFAVNLDDKNRWFRYHQLFQNHLQNQLKRRHKPEEIAALHSRAGRWFAENGFIDEAFRHMMDAGDVVEAAQLVEQNRQHMLNTDRWYVIEKWLRVLPEAVIQQQPELLMARVWSCYHHFEISVIPSVVDAVDAFLKGASIEPHMRAEINFFRGYICYFQNEGSRSLKYLQESLKTVPDECHEIQSQTEILYGLACQMQGREEGAVNRLNDMLYKRRPPMNIGRTRLLVTLVYIHVISGDLDKAFGANQQLFEFATNNNYAYVKEWSLYLKGLIHYYRNELEAAIDFFGQTLEEKHIVHTRALADSLAGLVLSFQAARKSGSVDETMQYFFDYAGTLGDPAFSDIAHSCHTRLSIMRGERQTVIDWLGNPPPPVENMIWWLEIPAVTHCRALLADGSAESLKIAETRLKELLQLNQDNHNTCHRIQVMPLLAMACHRQGREDEALTILKQAVDLSMPGRWIRPFAELGAPMADLLKQLMQQGVSVDYIQELVQAIPEGEWDVPPVTSDADVPSHHAPVSPAPIPPRPQPLVEPLTNRELEVLEMLERRLQTKEIAERLFISTETVKSHLKNIYQKLAIGNRRQAVIKAKELGIL